jgi:alkylation response protein AidB-like acyl-CoA dehydrogenase
VDLDFSEDQLMLRETVRGFLEANCPPSLVRQVHQPEAGGHSPELWQKLADGGWLGMGFGEDCDGGGASLFDLGIFYEESGRVLLPTPFYSTVHAGLLIEEMGTRDQRSHYLGRIVEGDMVGTVAFSELAAVHDSRYFSTQATNEGGHPLMSGQKAFVQNAAVADPLIVVARTASGGPDEGLTAFLVPQGSGGLSITAHQTFGKDYQAVVDLNAVQLSEDNVLGGPDAVDRAGPALERVLEKATALQVMEMAGGAQKVLDMTIDYVKERVQFGVPIGSFQAVQHHTANMATSIDGGRLAGLQALWLLSEGHPAKRELSIAKAWCNETYVFVTLMAHQLHGGMGYVSDYDLHLWSQRAKVTELTFGNEDYHLERVAEAIGL